MRTLSFLTFALLFGVPCFGKTAHLVRTQHVPTPNHVNNTRNGNCASMPSYMTSSSRFVPAEIVGGQDAPLPIPWQVSVRSWSSHFCGATILDESTLLCAAHCFPGSTSTTGKTIRAGSTQRSSGGQVRDISQIIKNNNPGFQYNSATMDNDFVILKLGSPLVFSDAVKPACLPSANYLGTSSTEERCFTSGWGTLSSGGSFLPETCQYVRVPVITNSDCDSDYGGRITDSMMCAGYRGVGGKDACQGDSGGPLVCNNGGNAIIAGVVSWGFGCAAPQFPGVYSRTTHVLDWIIANMGSSGTTSAPTTPTTTTKLSGCGSPQWATDKWCDDENNNIDCNWDGGACCNNIADGWDTYCKDCECLESGTSTTTATTTTMTTTTTTTTTTPTPVVCGGQFMGGSGVITSPEWPNTYPDNTNCVWEIDCNKDEHVEITFTSFDVEFNDNCIWDNVTIHESLTGAATAGPYCGDTVPPSYTSYGNWAAIKFISDSLVTKNGFEISYNCEVISSTTSTTTTSTTTKYTTGTTTPTTTTGTSGYCADMPSYMTSATRFDPAGIVGGQDAPSSIPWQVSVRSYDWHFCGATIIDKTTLLCAAHCFEGSSISGKSVRAGSTQKSSGGQVKSIAQIIWNNNAGFQYNSATYDNDFVILKLGSPLEFDADVQPACLPSSASYLDTSSTEERCFTSGWGTLSSGGSTPETCQYVRVPAITNADCYSDYGGKITDSMICAGYRGVGGKDACQGDSGGPFVCNDGGKAVLAGVVSWGFGCAAPQYPGVYSRVTHVLDWIESNMGGGGGGGSTYPPPTTTLPNSGCGSPNWANDQWCDDENNNAQCNWDGGACCNNNNAGWDTYCTDCECKEPGSTLTTKTTTTSSSSSSSGPSTVSPFICGDNFSGPSGTINSPGSPNNYPNNAKCIWQINCEKNKKVEITFNSFDVEYNPDNCTWDSVTISEDSADPINGALSAGPFCGDEIPATYTSAWEYAAIVFTSDFSETKPGFEISYQCKEMTEFCGEQLSGPSGSFHSPGYPNNYPDNAECFWGIDCDKGETVKITFNKFEVEDDANCQFDNVTIYEQPETGNPSKGPFCGNKKPKAYTTSGNYAAVEFISDITVNMAGFKVSYTCNKSTCKDKKPTKKCEKLKKKGKCKKKGVAKKCKKTCEKC